MVDEFVDQVVALVVLVTESFIVAAYALVYPCLHLMARYDDELQEFRSAALEAEHHDRANWIHDDVLGELRLARLRLERGETSSQELLAELDGIEHRLRLKQVDEVIRAGAATVAEILQPFLRMARSHGVDLVRVPTYETGALRVSATVGQAAQALLRCRHHERRPGRRAHAVDRCPPEHDVLVVEVEDDAGGYERSSEHQGRGLDCLLRELGPGTVTVDIGRRSHRLSTCRVELAATRWRRMTMILLIDDSAHVSELFAGAIRGDARSRRRQPRPVRGADRRVPGLR